MNYKMYLITLAVILVFSLIGYLVVMRNPWNKHKYVRLVTYNDDMSVSIRYYKRHLFNADQSLLINPKHIFNSNGYTSVITSSYACESINPLDFKSKYERKDFKSAMSSKLIKETFATLKVEKFDKMMMLLLLNAIQLVAIVYLLYIYLGAE